MATQLKEKKRKGGKPIDPQRGLGAAVRHLRKQAGMTQEELAWKSDVHPTHISHLEAGEINPRWGTMRSIAEGLGIDVVWLSHEAERFEARST